MKTFGKNDNSESLVEMLPCESMYRITVKQDGFEMTTYVSSMHLVDEKIIYLRKKIAAEARKSLFTHDDY